MPNSEMIIEMLREANPEALTMDGFDEALIGTAERMNTPTLAAYSANKIIEILMRDGMTYEEAVEYMDYNILGAWVGEGTPLIIFDNL